MLLLLPEWLVSFRAFGSVADNVCGYPGSDVCISLHLVGPPGLGINLDSVLTFHGNRLNPGRGSPWLGLIYVTNFSLTPSPPPILSKQSTDSLCKAVGTM